MNVISLKTLSLPYYAYCCSDKLIFEVPRNSPEIIISPDRYAVKFVICPECKKKCILEESKVPNFAFSDSNYKMFEYMRSLFLEKRVTELEYAPPTNGGTQFQQILKEAKDAGDF